MWRRLYVSNTARHLHQRIAEHKYNSIGKDLLEAHGDKNLLNKGQFCVLKKCHGKLDCLVYEMLFIKELKPVHYDEILDFHFFLHFRTQYVFPKYLGKSQSITNIRTNVFWTFIPEYLRPPLVFRFPCLSWEF